MPASTEFLKYVDAVDAASANLSGSSACLDTYIAAVAAADAALHAKIASCNGNRECEQIAVDEHLLAIKAARNAYFACVNSSPTGMVEDHYQAVRTAMVEYHNSYDEYVPPDE